MSKRPEFTLVDLDERDRLEAEAAQKFDENQVVALKEQENLTAQDVPSIDVKVTSSVSPPIVTKNDLVSASSSDATDGLSKGVKNQNEEEDGNLLNLDSFGSSGPAMM